MRDIQAQPLLWAFCLRRIVAAAIGRATPVRQSANDYGTHKFEPPVLIPNPFRTQLVSEGLPIEVEYLQEDIIEEVVDCHSLGR